MNKEGRSHSSIPLLADDDTGVNELRECSANKEARPSGRKKGLKMASLNVNGLLSKLDEIRHLAKNENIDIFNMRLRSTIKLKINLSISTNLT